MRLFWIRLVPVLTWIGLPLAVAGAASAEVPLSDAHVVLELKGAAPNGTDLTVYFDRHGGRTRGAFATARRFNGAPHGVDASGMTFVRGAVYGKLTVTLEPDASVPADGRPVACSFVIDADIEAGRPRGTYKGKVGGKDVSGAVSGRIVAPLVAGGAQRFTLRLEGALDGSGRRGAWKRVVVADFLMRDGEARTGLVRPQGSATYAVWSGHMLTPVLKWHNGRLIGLLPASVRGTQERNATSGSYQFLLDGRVIAGTAAGTFSIAKTERKGARSSRFLGEVRPARVPPAADCLYRLDLLGAIPGDHLLTVWLAAEGGRFLRAFAVSPTYNRANHDVNASRLRLEDRKIVGTVRVTIRPDAWVPKDGKPMTANYHIDAENTDLHGIDAFVGTCGGERVNGVLTVERIEPPRSAALQSLSIKMENALTGGNPMQNRAFFDVTFGAQGAQGARFWHNKANAGWTGTPGPAKLEITTASLKGTVAGTVRSHDSGTGALVRPGVYRFTLNGIRIAHQFVGECVTELDGREVKRGPFVADGKPAAAPVGEDRIAFRPELGFLELPDGLKLGQCAGVAIGAKGRIHLFHRGRRPILVFEPDGSFVRSFGDEHIGSAHGIRLDAKGNIWVTDVKRHHVLQFSPEGRLLLKLGESGRAGSGNGRFDRPTDVAFGRDGSVFVSDGYGNSRVVKFTSDGRFLKAWGDRGAKPGQFNLPHTIVVDAHGRVLVGDRENNRIQIFDADGKLLEVWPGFAPFGIAFGPAGTLFVADGRANTILRLDAKGQVLQTWGGKGAAAGEFEMPHMLAADRRGNLYVAEVRGKRLQRLMRKRP